MTIRELNANVSQALARVEGGETLDISRHGKVIAELRPKRRARDAEWLEAAKRADAIMQKGFDLGGGSLSEDDIYGDAKE